MRKWFRNFTSSGWFLPFILLLPYVVTLLLNGADKALLVHAPDVEEFVPLVLMAQIKADYEPETIKAQAVIARSGLYKERKENKGDIEKKSGIQQNKDKVEEENGTRNGDDVSLGDEVQNDKGVQKGIGKLQEILKSMCMEGWPWNWWSIIKQADALAAYGEAAESTKGQVLVHEGELKLVPYHEISCGKTRDGAEVFHSEEYAYLKSVDSSQDKDAPNYINSTYVAESQLPQKLVIKSRDSAGYVTSVLADGTLLEGETFRYGMHLASSNFSVQKVGKAVRFLCKGKGHGVGFSQYGGNEMAKSGSSWEEILEYYFPEMEIEDIR